MKGIFVGVLLVGLFAAAVLTISLASGWYRLALKFPASHGRPQNGRSWVSVSMGLSYLRWNFIGWSERGLYVSSMLRLSILLPPFEIPWSELRATGDRNGAHDVFQIDRFKLGIPTTVVRDIRPWLLEFQ